MYRYLLILTAALALASATLGGCGGDDEGATGSAGSSAATSGSAGVAEGGERSPKEQFIEDANAVCAEANERIQAQLQPYLKRNVSEGKEEAVIDEMLNEVIDPGMEEEIEEIRALGVPAGDEQQIEAVFTAMQGVVDEARADSSVFREKREPFKKPEELAVAYGLGSCGGL